MYDDLLLTDRSTQLLGLTKQSSAEIVAFADDVALLFTGHTTDILVERMKRWKKILYE